MAQCKAGTNLNCLSSSADRLFKPARIQADHCESARGVRVSLIKLNGLQGCFHALLQISDRIIAPVIGNDSGTYPAQPEMRFGQFRIEPASLAKQFSRSQMVLMRHLMKVPCPAPDQIPSRHVPGVACRGWRS